MSAPMDIDPNDPRRVVSVSRAGPPILLPDSTITPPWAVLYWHPVRVDGERLLSGVSYFESLAEAEAWIATLTIRGEAQGVA